MVMKLMTATAPTVNTPADSSNQSLPRFCNMLTLYFMVCKAGPRPDRFFAERTCQVLAVRLYLHPGSKLFGERKKV